MLKSREAAFKRCMPKVIVTYFEEGFASKVARLTDPSTRSVEVRLARPFKGRVRDKNNSLVA